MKYREEQFVDAGATQSYAEAIVAMYTEPTVLLGRDRTVLLANQAFHSQFQVSAGSIQGKNIAEIADQKEKLRSLADPPQAAKTGRLYFELEHPGPDRGRWVIRLNTLQIEITPRLGPLTVLTIEAISKRSDPNRGKWPLLQQKLHRCPEGTAAGQSRCEVLERVLENMPEDFIVLEAFGGRICLANFHDEPIAGITAEKNSSTENTRLRTEEAAAFFPYFRPWENARTGCATKGNFPALRSLKNGEVIVDEPWQVKQAGGAWRTVSVNSRPVPDSSGRITHAVMSWRYMESQTEGAEELRQAELQFRTLVENSPDIILRFDRKMRYRFVNTAFEQITGMSRESLCSRTNRELGMAEEQIRSWEAAAEEAVSKGRKVDFEFSFSGVLGRRHFLGWIVPECDSAGRVETLLFVGRDITERKQMEEQARYTSFLDKVTGLYNRAFFEAEIKRLDTARCLPISIIIGDVNYLKLTNDTFGHREGDRLLARVAEIMRRCCRNEDIIARWGGDEFAVILAGTDRRTAEEICERIRRSTVAHGSELLVVPSIALGAAAKSDTGENIYDVISAAEEHMYADKLYQSGKNRKAVIGSLLRRVKQKWPDYEEDLTRTRGIARVFAGTLGLNQREFKDLNLLSLLHDIGKVAVPDEYLRKPGVLTKDEWEVVKRYPETGFRIVKSFAETARVSDEILSLRERWDGRGYPRGLKGEEIPFLSRLFSIVDSYVAMTHERPYAPAMSPAQALRELCENADKQFDPHLVEKFAYTMAAPGRN